MKRAILRGFDFPARDVDDQLRFCNPLLSFEEGETAPIHFAHDLDWGHGSDDRVHWLTQVDTEEIESFATLFSGVALQIRRGEGVVLMGDGFIAAARRTGIRLDRNHFVEFTEFPESRFWLGLASPDSFSNFAKELASQAASIFDSELPATIGGRLPERGEAALALLRKCGLTRPTDLAIRQLAAARVTRQTDRYRRLLIRFSLELEETEDNLHGRVARHIAGMDDVIPVGPEQEQRDQSQVAERLSIYGLKRWSRSEVIKIVRSKKYSAESRSNFGTLFSDILEISNTSNLSPNSDALSLLHIDTQGWLSTQKVLYGDERTRHNFRLFDGSHGVKASQEIATTLVGRRKFFRLGDRVSKGQTSWARSRLAHFYMGTSPQSKLQ